jgi:hypothetical protein
MLAPSHVHPADGQPWSAVHTWLKTWCWRMVRCCALTATVCATRCERLRCVALVPEGSARASYDTECDDTFHLDLLLC